MDPEADRPERVWPRLWRGIGVLLLVFVFYALSIGPVFFLYPGTQELPRPLALFYSPLIWLCQQTDLGYLVDDYVVWWIQLSS